MPCSAVMGASGAASEEIAMPDSALDSILTSGLLGVETPLGSISHTLEQYFAADQTRTRAALMNFAIFSDQPDELPALDAQLQSITRDHACRGLLMTAGLPHENYQAQAWIKGQCHLDGAGGKFRCSEQVSFLVRGRSEGFLTNLIFANLRSDLPLVMWWQASLHPHFQERLYSRIDRLIFDSSRWADPPAEFAVVRQALESRNSQFQHGQPGNLLLHDLAYTRGHEHRRAIALLFDDPWTQQHIPALDRVEISYRRGHRHSALYLGAWLALQLQAGSPRSVAPDVIEYQRGGRPFALLLARDREPEGPILPAVTLSCPGAAFSLLPAMDGSHLQARAVSGGLRKEHLLPAHPKADVGLVGDIVMRCGTNVLLARVLPKFLELLDLAPGQTEPDKPPFA